MSVLHLYACVNMPTVAEYFAVYFFFGLLLCSDAQTHALDLNSMALETMVPAGGGSMNMRASDVAHMVMGLGCLGYRPAAAWLQHLYRYTGTPRHGNITLHVYI